MTQKLNRKELESKLKSCKAALSGKGQVPLFDSYIFGGGRVRAYNGIMEISVPYECEFAGGVDGGLLTRWLAAQTHDEITVGVPKNDDSKSVWRAGKRRLTLAVLTGVTDEGPSIEASNNNVGLDLDEHFRDYLRAAAVSMGTDSQQGWRQGVTFELGKDSHIFATDNVSVAAVAMHYETRQPCSFILEPEVVDALLAVSESPVRLIVGNPWVFFQYADERYVFARVRLDTDCERYRKIFDDYEFDGEFVPITKSFAQAVDQIAAVVKGADVRMGLACANGVVRFQVDNGNMRLDDHAKLEKHPEVELGATPHLVARALDLVDEIRMTDKALLFRSESVRHMIAPRS